MEEAQRTKRKKKSNKKEKVKTSEERIKLAKNKNFKLRGETRNMIKE